MLNTDSTNYFTRMMFLLQFHYIWKVPCILLQICNKKQSFSEFTDGKKKEPPYTKLSARESLASMNARMASNTYETVSDVDNLYATVSITVFHSSSCCLTDPFVTSAK